MRNMISGLSKGFIAAALFASAGSAAAANDGPARKGQEATAGSKQICKRLEQTATRLPQRKVCLSREDWKKLDAGDY